MPECIPARRGKFALPWFVLAPALALAGCGSQPGDDLEMKFARAEAAATRAENAQKAAEAAAKRAENDKIAAASEDVDTSKNHPAEPTQDEPEADQTSDDNSADRSPG